MRRPMKQVYLLLYAREYSISDSNTGNVNSGITMRGIGVDDMSPYDEMRQDGFLSKGSKPAKFNIPVQQKSKIRDIPGYYVLSFIANVVGDVLQNRLIDLDFVGPSTCKGPSPEAVDKIINLNKK